METSHVYRIVHFIPDPFTGGRVPIGALVMVDGEVVVVRGKPPCNQCLRPGAVSVIGLALRDMQRLKTLDLPRSCGPQIVADTLREIPKAVEDTVGWVERLLHGPV